MKIIETQNDLKLVYNKNKELIGLVLMSIFDDSLNKYLIKILKIDNFKSLEEIQYMFELEQDYYETEFEELHQTYGSIMNDFGFYSDDTYFVPKDKVLIQDEEFILLEELECYYTKKEEETSYGNVEITAGKHKGKLAYYDDEDRDSYGRPCGIIYLGQPFLSDYILLPFGNFKLSLKENKEVNKFEKNNPLVAESIGLVNIKYN